MDTVTRHTQTSIKQKLVAEPKEKKTATIMGAVVSRRKRHHNDNPATSSAVAPPLASMKRARYQQLTSGEAAPSASKRPASMQQRHQSADSSIVSSHDAKQLASKQMLKKSNTKKEERPQLLASASRSVKRDLVPLSSSSSSSSLSLSGVGSPSVSRYAPRDDPLLPRLVPAEAASTRSLLPPLASPSSSSTIPTTVTWEMTAAVIAAAKKQARDARILQAVTAAAILAEQEALPPEGAHYLVSRDLRRHNPCLAIYSYGRSSYLVELAGKEIARAPKLPIALVARPNTSHDHEPPISVPFGALMCSSVVRSFTDAGSNAFCRIMKLPRGLYGSAPAQFSLLSNYVGGM